MNPPPKPKKLREWWIGVRSDGDVSYPFKTKKKIEAELVYSGSTAEIVQVREVRTKTKKRGDSRK